MRLFNSEKNKQIIARLRASEQNFTFDRQAHKDRVLLSLATIPAQIPTRAHCSLYGFTFKLAVGMAIALLTTSTTFFIAQGAVPGDTLFPINKLRENLVLALPLSFQKRVDFTADIAQSRFESLDLLPLQKAATTDKLTKKKIQTVDESQKSFEQAVDVISRQQADLEAAGQTAAAASLDNILTDLTQMADQRHELIEQLADESRDKTDQAQIRSNIKRFEQTRQKAERQLKRRLQIENRSE